MVPSTGEVRYAIVADPAFGIGSYIEVPAVNARALADRVVVSGTSEGWRQAPRYTTDQVQRQFGSP